MVRHAGQVIGRGKALEPLVLGTDGRRHLIETLGAEAKLLAAVDRDPGRVLALADASDPPASFLTGETTEWLSRTCRERARARPHHPRRSASAR
jgi:hypothetical protein